MSKKYIISGAFIIVAAALFYFLYPKKAAGVNFLTLKTPDLIKITGLSAKYVGREQYEVQANVKNGTEKNRGYMPVFALMLDSTGKRIGYAMCNTGPSLKPGDTVVVTMDTVIPKEFGRPHTIELYAELGK